MYSETMSLTETKKRLKEIIEESYKIFSKYKLGNTLDVCLHCVTAEEFEPLLETPLREISQEMIYKYYSSAQNYGEQELYELKYFLPRILELLTEFEFPYHSTEISLSRFNLEKSNFELKEKEILEQFAENYFAYCLETYPLPDFEEISSIIVMFGLAEFKIRQVLEKWIEKFEESYLLHLNDFFLNQVDYAAYKTFRLRTAFSTKEINAEIFSWLEEDKTKSTFAKNIEIAIAENILEDFDETQLSMLYESMIL